MKYLLREGWVFTLMLCLFAIGTVSAQQAYPTRPINMLLGFPAGGGTDFVARVVASKLSEQMGVPVAVVNRPGANANIATELAVKAPADGYTVLFQTSAIAISPALYAKLNYDVMRDLAPVALIGITPLVFVVHPSVPAANMVQFIEYAKKNSAKLSYSSNGSGNVSHLAAVSLMQGTGIDATHVPYKGAAPALTALAGGEVQFSIQTPGAIRALASEQRIKPLAVATLKRVPTLPDLPTLAETVLPNFEFSTWQGIMVPAKTPAAIIARINGEIVKALRDRDVQAKFAGADTVAVGSTPDEHRAYLQREIERSAKAAKAAGLTPE